MAYNTRNTCNPIIKDSYGFHHSLPYCRDTSLFLPFSTFIILASFNILHAFTHSVKGEFLWQLRRSMCVLPTLRVSLCIETLVEQVLCLKRLVTYQIWKGYWHVGTIPTERVTLSQCVRTELCLCGPDSYWACCYHPYIEYTTSFLSSFQPSPTLPQKEKQMQSNTETPCKNNYAYIVVYFFIQYVALIILSSYNQHYRYVFISLSSYQSASRHQSIIISQHYVVSASTHQSIMDIAESC